MTEFPSLSDDARRRLEERGIDIERSYEMFQVELRSKPPEELLDDLFHAVTYPEEEISGKLPRPTGLKGRGHYRKNKGDNGS